MPNSNPHITGKYALLAAVISGCLGIFGIVINNYLGAPREEKVYESVPKEEIIISDEIQSFQIDRNKNMYYQEVLSSEKTDYKICERFLLMPEVEGDFQTIFTLLEKRKLNYIFAQNFPDDELFIALSEYVVDFPNTNELSRILRLLKDLDRSLPFGERPGEKFSSFYKERIECVVTYQGPVVLEGDRIDEKLNTISTFLTKRLAPYSNEYDDFDQVDIENTLSNFIVNMSVDSGNKTEIVREILREFKKARRNLLQAGQKGLLSNDEIEIRAYFSDFPTYLICSNSWEDRPLPPPPPPSK